MDLPFKKITRSKAVARIADRTADASQHTKPTCIWVTTWPFSGPRDVTGHVTIRFPAGHLLLADW